jgi:predicted dehydrogenase
VRLSVRAASTSAQDGDLSVAVLGAGDYVWSEVVPAIRRAGLNRLAICDREPQLAAEAARRLGFATAFTDASAAIDVLDRPGVVVIATNHDSHAELASYALDQGHRVFLEKPAVVTAADLELLTAAVRRAPGRLEIGFNRRYNPLVRTLREELSGTEGPLTLVITIRELTLAPDHWYFWPNQGTRVAGNLCHWLDLAIHLLGPGANPIGMTVSPRIAPGLAGLDTERALSIQFSDGSAAVLVATDRGDDIRGVQEHIEARRGSLTARLDDLWRLALLRQGRISRRRTLWRDKGNQRMYRDAFRRFTRDEPALYPIRDLALVIALQLAATDLVTSGEASRELKGLGADAESMLRAEGGP